MHSIVPTVALCLCSCGFAAAGAPPAHVERPAASDQPMLGFSAASTRTERELEARFDSALSKEELREWMKRMTARPHHLGSQYGKEVAEFIAAQMRTWGYQVEVEEFQVLFPTPKARLLEMTAPGKLTASLAEPPLAGDATSGLTDEELPTYNAYSIDGDVTAALVYVNYGTPKDYELLAERGVETKGKIAIARYGGCWRGLKPKLAAEHGAVGCIIYSDPREEGYFEGDVYPEGSWRNEHGVERGSVADLPVAPGDPLTPGIGATKDAKRLSLDEAQTLTRIPVLPISYGDALPLLRALGGPMAPESWRGALPIPYHLGPGPATVHLKVEFNWQTVTARDVIARLEGSERPEQWVIRGNHHDAWVFGADDPISGTVALMEEARVIGELARSGWRPKRTIVFAAWDGEEPGLLGSTEWVETHGDALRSHAVAYINGDDNERGFLRVAGSHSLEHFVNQIGQDVQDPEKHVPVNERARARALSQASADDRNELRQRPDLRIRALGSGSDYTPFLQHAGIASLDVRFSGEGEGGAYHSIYDSFDYYTRFIDPSFDYGIALAQTTGRAVLRLANADLLPFQFTTFADTVARYAKEITKLADDMRDDTKEYNRLLADNTLQLAADPTQPFVPPKPKSPVPYFNFAPLNNAIDRLRTSAQQLEDHLAKSRLGSHSLPSDAERKLDEAFMSMERFLTREEGLPRRPWYKHMIYAPGFYTGYAVKTLPGVREAIEQRQWSDVNDQVEIVARVLDRYSDQLDRAQRLVRESTIDQQ
jgi:N-acetylated-alpha-linked acidic dipeptidase